MNTPKYKKVMTGMYDNHDGFYCTQIGDRAVASRVFRNPLTKKWAFIVWNSRGTAHAITENARTKTDAIDMYHIPRL